VNRDWTWMTNKIATNPHGSLKSKDFVTIMGVCRVLHQLDISKIKRARARHMVRLSNMIEWWK
jgi:hypothetical protein